MWRKILTIAAALLLIVSVASVASAQRNANSHRKAPDGRGQPDNPGNSDHGETPGNSNPGENPGNGNQGEDPNDSPGGTHDEWTPAEEDTCDVLKGGTPGLYGLCIAFCEAHDCEPDFTRDDGNYFANCRKSDSKILRNYERKMKDGDPYMPCAPRPSNDPQEVTCPCWGEAELAVYQGWDSFCEGDTEYDVAGDGSCYQDYNDFYDEFEEDDSWGWFFLRAAMDNGCADGAICTYSFNCFGPGCPEFDVTYVNPDQGISQAEYEVCRQDVLNMTAMYCD